MSKINKADAEFIVGFVPEGVVSGFTNYVLFNSNGSWTVPNGVNKIRIILVGGGSGGQGGYKGEDGTSGEHISSTGGDNPPGIGGAGGKGGIPGVGGQIYELTLDVAPGQTITHKIGAGGAGGAAEGGAGSLGAATTLTHNNTTYSSALGKYYNYGYYETKSGLTFANAGAIGYDGASGGQGGPWQDSSGKYHYYEDRAQSGYSLLSWSGGLGAYGETWEHRNGWQSGYSDGGGGGGGGAAYGAKGGDGQFGYANSQAGSGGDGGKGATPPTPAAPTNYGQGGNAGHGGGGGGGGGGSRAQGSGVGRPGTSYNGAGGKGGAGSAGGAGKAGCVVIYY